jgi:hypothetical protein
MSANFSTLFVSAWGTTPFKVMGFCVLWSAESLRRNVTWPSRIPIKRGTSSLTPGREERIDYRLPPAPKVAHALTDAIKLKL